jgi:hypothetical protein
LAAVHVRRCRACAEEYRPEVVTCVECGGPLEDADDEVVPFEARPVPAPVARAVPPERKPPEGYVPVYVGRHLADVEPLADGLEEADIPFHVHETPEKPDHTPAVYSLLVPEGEAPRARRALGPLLGEGADPEAVDRGFDLEAGYTHCPACSAEIPGGAETCPDCGLTVSPDVEGEG